MNTRKLKEKILKDAKKILAQKVYKAKVFLVNQVKTAVSGPYIPGTKTPYRKPPRMRTGRLRRSIDGIVDKEKLMITITANAKSDKGFGYPKFHEEKSPGHPRSGRHPFIKVTIRKNKDKVKEILSQ